MRELFVLHRLKCLVLFLTAGALVSVLTLTLQAARTTSARHHSNSQTYHSAQEHHSSHEHTSSLFAGSEIVLLPDNISRDSGRVHTMRTSSTQSRRFRLDEWTNLTSGYKYARTSSVASENTSFTKPSESQHQGRQKA